MVDLVGLKRACKVKLWAGRERVSDQGGGRTFSEFRIAERPARVNCTGITMGATTGDLGGPVPAEDVRELEN